jgi:hypothetical protein
MHVLCDPFRMQDAAAAALTEVLRRLPPTPGPPAVGLGRDSNPVAKEGIEAVWGLALARGPRAADVCLVPRKSASASAAIKQAHRPSSGFSTNGHGRALTRRSKSISDVGRGSGRGYDSNNCCTKEGSSALDMIGTISCGSGDGAGQVAGPSESRPGRVEAKGPVDGDGSGAELRVQKASPPRRTRRPASAAGSASRQGNSSTQAVLEASDHQLQGGLLLPDGHGRLRTLNTVRPRPLAQLPSSQPPSCTATAGCNEHKTVSGRGVSFARSKSPDRRAQPAPDGSKDPGRGHRPPAAMTSELESPQVDEWDGVAAAGTALEALTLRTRMKTPQALADALRTARNARWSARFATAAALREGGESYGDCSVGGRGSGGRDNI